MPSSVTTPVALPPRVPPGGTMTCCAATASRRGCNRRNLRTAGVSGGAGGSREVARSAELHRGALRAVARFRLPHAAVLLFRNLLVRCFMNTVLSNRVLMWDKVRRMSDKKREIGGWYGGSEPGTGDEFERPSKHE